MKIFSRRNDDPREVWQEGSKSDDETLMIPPCDIWDTPPDKTSEVNSTPHETSLPIASDKTPSQCWAFLGARGGVGTTTLSVETAFHLAKNHYRQTQSSPKPGQEKVCLIDLDFETGSVSHHLDIEPGLRLEDLSNEPTRIDADLTRSFISRHKSGIAVLAAPNMIGTNLKVNPHTVVAILESACDMFPHVILDLPVQWQSWSLAALGGSDYVGLLSDLTIPSLHLARNKRAQIGLLLERKKSCDIILNKYERRSFGNNLRLPDAQKALQCEIFGTVCNDAQTVHEAINCGDPVGNLRKDSRYAKDSRKLIEKIFEKTKTTLEYDMQELAAPVQLKRA